MAENEFDEYLKAKEPGMREKAYAWKTAIGLQKVDGLTPSAYLIQTAKRNIEGEITLAQSRELVEGYYKTKQNRAADDSSRTAEADIVSQHITEILSEDSFTFSVAELISIHRRLFTGVYKFAGQIRDYDITKNEWVLKGDTVHYGAAYRLVDTLNFDISQEREFSYVGLSEAEMIRHISRFVAGLWQIHAFGEGNTRTTGVFTIKYLRTLGFDVRNDVFAENAWYFRNALVRANYTNIPHGIEETTEYLERFFENLLFGAHNELKNRYLLIGGWQDDDGEHHTSSHTSNHASNPSFTMQLKRLLAALEGEMSRAELMKAIGLKSRVTFTDTYLAPALKLGIVELTQPGSPRSPTQRYRLTPAGSCFRTQIA